MPILKQVDIKPTVFINSAFVEGMVYYRVLVPILCQKHTGTLAETLRDFAPDVNWSSDPKQLFAQTKNEYRKKIIQQAVEKAYASVLGNPKDLLVHLDLNDIQEVLKENWEIGNHTVAHETLSKLTDTEINVALSKNQEWLKRNDIPHINWVSHPNGLSRHVNLSVLKWMNSNPDMNGIFAGGGVNFVPSRTQWLRIGIGDCDLMTLDRAIKNNIVATKKGLIF